MSTGNTPGAAPLIWSEAPLLELARLQHKLVADGPYIIAKRAKPMGMTGQFYPTHRLHRAVLAGWVPFEQLKTIAARPDIQAQTDGGASHLAVFTTLAPDAMRDSIQAYINQMLQPLIVEHCTAAAPHSVDLPPVDWEVPAPPPEPVPVHIKR